MLYPLSYEGGDRNIRRCSSPVSAATTVAEGSVVVSAGGVGSAGVVRERPGHILLNSFVDRVRVGEDDLDVCFLQPFLDG